MIDQLWAAFGAPTITVLTDGTQTLATLWESAWKLGKGDTRITAKNLTALPLGDLQALYENTQFVPSLDLDDIGTVLR